MKTRLISGLFHFPGLFTALYFPVDIIERQPAHKVRDPLGRAYNRTQFIDDRRKMMQEWGRLSRRPQKQYRQDRNGGVTVIVAAHGPSRSRGFRALGFCLSGDQGADLVNQALGNLHDGVSILAEYFFGFGDGVFLALIIVVIYDTLDAIFGPSRRKFLFPCHFFLLLRNAFNSFPVI